MKKTIRIMMVTFLCVILIGGISVPNVSVGNALTCSKVTTAQAKTKVRKKFKKAMDKYYKFYKKYCKFMKKYKKGGNAVTMLNDYMDLLEQQQKVDKAFKKWENKDLSKQELAYFNKINLKVIDMLSNM